MNKEAQRAQWRDNQRRWRSSPGNKAKAALRRNKTKERATTARRKSTPEGWAKAALPRLRYRAAKMGLEFNLVWTDIVPPSVCPVLGKPLALCGSHSRLNWWAPSVDRIDNSKGYVRDNVAVISNRANILKKDATPDELRRLWEYVS